MSKSGQVTHDYVLPAVAQAGVPIEMAVAGASGTLLGGPLGGIGAVTSTKMLNNQFLPKYDPSKNQKSKVLGTVSGVAGDVGKTGVKSVAKGGKLKVNMKALNSIKNIAHEMGNPLSQVTKPTLGVSVNPFDAGYALGHDVISPYVVDPIKNS